MLSHVELAEMRHILMQDRYVHTVLLILKFFVIGVVRFHQSHLATFPSRLIQLEVRVTHTERQIDPIPASFFFKLTRMILAESLFVL